MGKLSASYYISDDVVSIANSLLGKYLYCNTNNILTGGIITETEAYKGVTDKASHSYGGRLTNRTKTMYEKGGIAYIYLCYGIHYLLNVVTADINTPHAILIRSIYPLIGVPEMLARTSKKTADYNLTIGPGKLTKAMGITNSLNGVSYLENELWIEDKGIVINEEDIYAGSRIGVEYAEEDAALPYRFVLNHNNYIKKTH